MKRLSDMLGRWKEGQVGALLASVSWDRGPRLQDEDALIYGGPFMVGESISARGRAFLEGLPIFVWRIENIANDEDVPQRLREELAHCLEFFFKPLTADRLVRLDPRDRGQEDVIEELCKLRSFVNREVFGHQRAADCVCRGAPSAPEHFRDDGVVIQFMRAAVIKAVAEVKRGRVAKRRTTIVRPLP